MKYKKRSLEDTDLPLVEFEGANIRKRAILCKHASKHMSFNTKEEYEGLEIIERGDGVAYDPKNSIFYQSKRFRQ